MEYTDLRVYPSFEKELSIVAQVLANTPSLSSEERNEAEYLWMENKDFTIIGLFSKPPRYLKGVKKYSEYYLQVTPQSVFEDLAVRKDFTDITSPLVLNIPNQGVDDANDQLYIGGDMTQYIEAGDTHYVLDQTTYDVKGALTVVSANYVGLPTDATIITYQAADLSGINAGDIISFTKGEELVGLHIDITWYNTNGSVGWEKRVTRRFSKHEAANYEYSRRRRTINQMIAAATGTAIQPFVTTIFKHYDDLGFIDNYINFGDHQGLKDAIDAETDPVISGYLAIVVPFTDIEGNTLVQPISEAIKNDLYEGYK
jgi:hypothetical protein